MHVVGHKRAIATDKQIKAIVAEYPTPFHLYSEKIIRARIAALLDAFSWNPGFREYFAVKANPNPELIRILLEAGCGLDCATGTELILAEALGLSGHDIMFSSNETPRTDYEYAARLGVITNLDDATQFEHYLEAAGGFPDTMCVRYNPGGTFEFGGGVMGNPGEAKYGMTRPQLFETLAKLRDAGVERLGVHAFLASNATADSYYPALARTLFELAVDIQEELGIRLAFCNLSGGVGVAYRPQDHAPDIAVIGAGVHAVYQEILEPAGLGDVAIYTELGRWIMAPAGNLVARVIGEKHIYRDYLGLDASASDLLRPMLYGAYHHISVVDKEDEPHDHVYDVVGGLCENGDKFAQMRELPESHCGDIVVIHDTGAHGHSMGFTYNGKLRHAELLLQEDGSVRCIRRAETPADYFATLDILPIDERLQAHTGKEPA